MPFLTEEIWQILEPKELPRQALIVASWPERLQPYDETLF